MEYHVMIGGKMSIITDPLSSSKLFKRLDAIALLTPEMSALPGNVTAITHEAEVHLRRSISFHPQFTLHDDIHCRRVVDLMGRVLGDEAINQLNAIDCALLILSGYLHDIGMVPDDGRLLEIKNSTDWKLHEELWAQDHPNYGETGIRLNDPNLNQEQRGKLEDRLAQLRAAMFSDFIRERHGKFSAKFVIDRYKNDPRLNVADRNLADLLARLCLSHVMAPDKINDTQDIRLDEAVGTYQVNMQRIAYVLRIADILDFDRDRTPDSLYLSISFTSRVSLREWEKHRGVNGWTISPERIVFDARYDQPAYERACRQFFDGVDAELLAASRWSRGLPSVHSKDRIQLPENVDRSRISPTIDPLTGLPAYKFFDLEFSLSRDEVVKLLMTNKLYSGENLFVRELLQNALDALRHRTALYKCANITLNDQQVNLTHTQDAAGFHIVRCVDNGVGMDADIVRRFLTRAGRSYYRSPHFEQERVHFRERDCDFDPCARFGIGFISCFMFGDEIIIHTRKDFGPQKQAGEPLIVEIAGLSGIITVRVGLPDQPTGTTVEVRSRRAQRVFDFWDDPVRLNSIVSAYAIATEYPIIAEAALNGRTRRIEVPTSINALPHFLERLDLKTIRILSRSFAEADNRLRGEIRYAYIANEQGSPVLKNSEVQWTPGYTDKNPRTEPKLIRVMDVAPLDTGFVRDQGQFACDGILIAGHRGRKAKDNHFISGYSLNHQFGRLSFVLDARSTIKPELTPARTPPEATNGIDEVASWRRVFSVAGKAFGLLLDDLAARCAQSGDPAQFWHLAEIDNLNLDFLEAKTCLDYISFPFSKDLAISWSNLKNIGALQLFRRDTDWGIMRNDGAELLVPSTVSAWKTEAKNLNVTKLRLIQLLLLCSEFGIQKNKFELKFGLDRNMRTMNEQIISANVARLYCIDFHPQLKNCFCIAESNGLTNANNAIIQRIINDDSDTWQENLLSSLCHMLAYGTSNGGNLADQLVKAKSNWWFRRLGTIARDIDWNSEPVDLRPPYHYLDSNGNIRSITKEELVALAELTPSADDDEMIE